MRHDREVVLIAVTCMAAAKAAGVEWYTPEHDVPKPDALTVLRDGLAYSRPRMEKAGIVAASR